MYPTRVCSFGDGSKEISVAEMTYRVPAMHCDNCARAVRQEVSEVEGVESVSIDLETKLVTVRGEGLSDEALLAAIVEAGYEAVAA